VETAIDKVSYKSKLIRLQRIINNRIAKAYRTVVKVTLCILTGLTPIAIKIEEAFQFYEYIRGSSKEENGLIVTWELNTGITPQKR
jgi:hypothetical protein